MMLWLRKLRAAGADLCLPHIFALSLLFILMSNGCQPIDPKSTIVKDIQRALSIITNDTNILNNIMHKMYKPALMQQSEPMVVFQLPNEGKSSPTSAATTTIEMMRSDFMTPTFPNITYNEMMERIKRLPSTTTTAHQWQLLGLSGWSGELSQQQNMQLKGISSESDSMNEYPIKEILKDLYDGAEKSSQSDADTAKAIEISSNVYIARVNDPFGYSTKWEMRNSTETRTKRDIVELYSMIKCATGCDPLGYKGYGCYCGFSGGGVPVDSIDYCCKIHDKCYEQAGNCISYLEYFVPYVWKCYFGKPLCALDHGEWGGPLSCAARLCYCDVQLSFCLRRFICPWKRATCPTRFARFLNLIT